MAPLSLSCKRSLPLKSKPLQVRVVEVFSLFFLFFLFFFFQGLPVGPAIKIIRKLADIRGAMKDCESFRQSGLQLGKPIPSAAVNESGPVFKPNVALTMRQKPRPAEVDSSKLLFAGNEATERVREQLGGGRKRTPTISLAPDAAEQLQQALERAGEEEASGGGGGGGGGGRVVSSAPNFFDLFGLNNANAPPNKPLPAPPAAAAAEVAPAEESPADVLNMQLNPETGKLVVMSGSFSDVIDCIVFYVNISDHFANEMLFTHRYFCPTKNLLNAFRAHFLNTQSVVEQAKTPMEAKSASKVMEQVQERLIGLIELWIECHFYFFDENPELLEYFQRDFMAIVILDKGKLQRLFHLIGATVIVRNYHTSYRSKRSSVAKEEVLSQLMREDKSGLIMDRRKNLRLYKQAFVAVEAINLIMRKLKIVDRAVAISLLDGIRERGTIVNAVKESDFEDGDSLWQFRNLHRPPPAREDCESANLLDMNAQTVAEQLTLIEFETFQQIVPIEISHQAWSKDGGARAPNVMTLINSFNATTYWVASEIVNQSKLEARVGIVVKMIEIAERCEQIHNYQTLMEILVGLSMGPVSRLTQTWEAVPKEKLTLFQKLQSLIDNRKNYNNYRMVLKDAPLPCFPYVGLALKDLTFIEDGNENFLDPAKQVINWQKMSMIASVFRDVQRFQQSPYDFDVKPHLNQHFRTGRCIVTDDTELYNLSFMCQARQQKTKE